MKILKERPPKLPAPVSRQRVVRGAVDLRGQVAHGASLSVNGRDIALSQDGRFRTSLKDIEPGTLIFRVRKPGTPDAYFLRRLR